jgi:deoxyribodipyrimidine photo-lyase
VLKNDGTPYLVFTPFYNRSKAICELHHMIKYEYASHTLIPYDYKNLHVITDDNVNKNEISLQSLGFIAQILTPHQLLTPMQKLERFASKLCDYQKDRDYLAFDASSGLSTDLRFGTLSIRTLLRWLRDQKKRGADTEPFFRQLIFRDFYAMLLYHFPHLEKRNFRYRFRGEENEEYFQAFCNAQTGVAIVDAGVRQLLETGEMHNRVRMIVASFFTKNLLLPWQWGERFFSEHLMDYDAASNILSWQWSAGTGVDPQPYFRIFNPTTQSEKFDKNQLYITRYLPNDYRLEPIDDHKESSAKALEYFKKSL